jgi:hypothetical protein
MNKSSNSFRERASKIRSRWRKFVTGDEKKRIRDHIREAEEQPSYVKFFDKLAFTFGVLNILVCQYFLLNTPAFFWLWYSFIVPILLCARFYYFSRLGWHYFMIDFCYYVLLCTLVNIFILKDSTTFFKTCFIYATGPLVVAILIWRNSLIFHDYDKIVSVYIHLLPSMLYYTLRWTREAGESRQVLTATRNRSRCDDSSSCFRTCSFWGDLIQTLLFSTMFTR